MTVNEMDGLLSRLVNDPNSEVWTQTIRLEALNSAQRELVLYLLGFGQKNQDVFTLLSEIETEETVAIDSTGVNLASMVTNRYFLRNGYVNARFVDADGYTRWVERIAASKLGITENRYFEGTTRDPRCYISGNKLYLLVSVGSYPIDLILTYIGAPKVLATSVTGSGRDATVTTSELNVLFHDLIVLMAEVKLRRMRGDKTDFEQASFVWNFCQQQMQLLVSGSLNEPQTKTVGQFARNQDNFMVKRTTRNQGVQVNA